MMVFALLNVITVCPVLAHQAEPSQSCCEHWHGEKLPCTDTTPHNCPYVLLEKSQGKIAAWVYLLTGGLSPIAEALGAGDRFSSPIRTGHRTDFSRSYLLFRNLLI